MRAFIVRPFGTKNGIDFERIDAELIQPALLLAKIAGATTGEILAQGNIRSDMFQRLVASDLVIADMTLNNPNVFYELGIRHGLRQRATILLRGRSDEVLPDVPFDLKTDRYLEYAIADPKLKVAQLAAVIAATASSNAIDSPVYQLLPALCGHAIDELLRVPQSFLDDVMLAKKENRRGDLQLYAEDICDEIWESQGLREIGRALRGLRAYESAHIVWARVQRIVPGDLEADMQQATILQRLGELDAADITVERALLHPGASYSDKAELCALQGSNLKLHWCDDWCALAADRRQLGALRSPFLERMSAAYKRGLLWDPAHYYSAINALAAVAIHTMLAGANEKQFRNCFETPAQADSALAKLQSDREALRLAVITALQSARQRGDHSRWTLLTDADLALLSAAPPGVVQCRYDNALANADRFDVDALDRQFALYESLGLFADAVTAAREALADARQRIKISREPERAIVFTGHRLDAPGRKSPRFPADENSITKAKALIRDSLVRVIGPTPLDRIQTYAAAANGGDILFLETCRELGIAATILLAVPRDDFVPLSVAHPSGNWVARFDALLKYFPARVLADELKPAPWLFTPAADAIAGAQQARQRGWARNGRWILHQGLAHGADRMSLIAFWNGQQGDGPGGTADLVAMTKARGAEVETIDTAALLG